jgi:putative transposase
MCIYGFVVMPEHVHLLVSEPEYRTLADAIHHLKLSSAKRFRANRLVAQVRAASFGANLGLVTPSDMVAQVRAASFGANLGPFWQKRYYDRNIRDAREFTVKLRYLHRNPVRRGLVSDPAHWRWSSFRHYALREIGLVEIESEWTARDREIKIHGGPTRVFLNPG